MGVGGGHICKVLLHRWKSVSVNSVNSCLNFTRLREFWLRVIGEITLLGRGLLHKLPSLLSHARNHNIICYLWDNFSTALELHSAGEDPVIAHSRPISDASLCVSIRFPFAHTAR